MFLSGTDWLLARHNGAYALEGSSMPRLYPPFLGDPQAVGLLTLRVIAGFGLMLHGYPKFVHGLSWMGTSSHLPGYIQVLSPIAEFGGGLFLMLGFLTPLACLAIMGNMAVALFYVHFANHDPFVAPAGWTGSSYEAALDYLGISVMFLLIGPGIHSLDAVFFIRSDREESSVRERELVRWR